MPRIMLSAMAGLVLLISSMPVAVMAHDYRKGDIVVNHPRTKASLGKKTAVYLTLENQGDTTDRLIAVESDVASEGQLHTNKIENDVVRMRRVKAFEINPGTPTILEPGSHHIMLVGLKRQFKEGELLPLTLVFERAGRIRIDAYVEGWGQPDGRDMPGHGHGS